MIELLNEIRADITFRPKDGEFCSKLVEIAIDNADEGSVDLFSPHNCDIQVSVSARSIEEGMIRFLVVSDLGKQSLECDISELNGREIRDLTGQLSRLIDEQSLSETDDATKVFIRKNSNGMLDTHQAAQKLGCSRIFLKSKIPCTDYTYREVDGKKEIIEYYWSNNLIDRLCQIKLNGANPEEVKFIAGECCYGDCKWAEEILVSLVCPVSTPKVAGAVPNGMTKRPAKNIARVFANKRSSRKKKP